MQLLAKVIANSYWQKFGGFLFLDTVYKPTSMRVTQQ